MKTKELIRRLHQMDPTGEAECCIDNADILDVQGMPAYWDGRLEVLIRDPSKTGITYDIVGAKVTPLGQKVKIVACPIEELVYGHPDVPIDLSELTDQSRAEWEPRIEEWREEGHRIEASLAKEVVKST